MSQLMRAQIMAKASISKGTEKKLQPQRGLRSSVGAANRELAFENDRRFLKRIEQARESVRAGKGLRLEDVH